MDRYEALVGLLLAAWGIARVGSVLFLAGVRGRGRNGRRAVGRDVNRTDLGTRSLVWGTTWKGPT